MQPADAKRPVRRAAQATAPLLPARVRVPCSTSNLGAGFDCLGLAFGLYLDASFTPAPGRLKIVREGTLSSVGGDDLLTRAFRDALAARGITPTGTLEATSQIPVARGLGSSAAAVIAGLSLAAGVTGETLDLDSALEDAVRTEGHADNAAPALLGGLVAVTFTPEGRVLPFRLPLSGALAFAWAAPPVEVSTAEARKVLPRSVRHDVAARAVSRTAALIEGLANAEPDLLRAGFQDELHVPHRLPLIPGAADAMQAALDAGAIAVTVSGSGSGLLAVCPPGLDRTVATAMADRFRAAASGAAQRRSVLSLTLEPDLTGARILPP